MLRFEPNNIPYIIKKKMNNEDDSQATAPQDSAMRVKCPTCGLVYTSAGKYKMEGGVKMRVCDACIRSVASTYNQVIQKVSKDGAITGPRAPFNSANEDRVKHP